MRFTVRLPLPLDQALAEYSARHGMSKNQAVLLALARLMRDHVPAHPFIGGDIGDGSDVSGTLKSALRSYRMPS